MIKFILANRKIIAPLAGGLALVALIFWLRFVWIKEGREGCQAEYKAAMAAAQEKAQKQIGEIIHDHNEIIANLPQGADYPAPAVDAAIDRLRDRRSGQ